MKTHSLNRTLSVVLIIMSLGFVPPVFGDDADMKKALDLVHQVENSAGNPPSDAQRIEWLTQAMQLAKEAPNHRLKGHRVQAIQDIKAALFAIQGGDPDHKAINYIRDAESELSTAVSLANNIDTAPVATAAPPTTPAIPSPAAPPATIPSEVTPEMEQAFLAKYKAALEKPDPDAFFSLFAFDPNLDPKVKEDMKGLYLFSLALTVSNPNRTYSFVPIAPGKEDKPSAFKGKMYGTYLPAVVGLKISFGKPAHASSNEPAVVGDSTQPLCIENNQLMLIGAKEIPGAVPPPAMDKAANFGIVPNLRKVSEQAGEDGNAFTSLDEFLSSLKQPRVEILDSGDTKYEYYAICRIAPNLCVWASGDKVKGSDYSFYFRATDANKQELKGSQKWIRLVDVPTDDGQAPNVQGTVFFCARPLCGPDNHRCPVHGRCWKQSLLSFANG